MSKCVISTEGLEVGYDQPLLKIPDMDLGPTRLVALLGKNGSGKSTFLRTITGLISPLKGAVKIDGQEAQKMARKELAKKIAISLHDSADHALRVEELVRLGRYPWQGFLGRSTAEDENAIEHALHRTELIEFRQKRLAELSDGEKQRVYLARALAQNTEVLLLDEPLAFLDVTTKVSFIRLLKELSGEGKLIIFSSHDLQLVLDHCDELAIIDDGALILSSAKAEAASGVLSKVFGCDEGELRKGRVRF